MEKLWAGAAHGALDAAADSFNSSIGVDARMYREDIRGSMAHAAMLAKCGIVSAGEGAQLIAGLGGILADLESGTLAIDPAAEDIHSFVEATLTARLGAPQSRTGRETVWQTEDADGAMTTVTLSRQDEKTLTLQ